MAKSRPLMMASFDTFRPKLPRGWLGAVRFNHCFLEHGVRLANVMPKRRADETLNVAIGKHISQFAGQRSGIFRRIQRMLRKRDSGSNSGPAVAFIGCTLILEPSNMFLYHDRNNWLILLSESQSCVVPTDVGAKPNLQPWTQAPSVDRHPDAWATVTFGRAKLINNAGTTLFAAFCEFLQELSKIGQRSRAELLSTWWVVVHRGLFPPENSCRNVVRIANKA